MERMIDYLRHRLKRSPQRWCYVDIAKLHVFGGMGKALTGKIANGDPRMLYLFSIGELLDDGRQYLG
jgi:hypothetical protein